MKNMKKVASFLLVLVMVLGLATTAFAAGDGKITVDNAKESATYRAYKIFDVTYTADKTDDSGYAYTINENSEWYQTVKAYADVAENGLTLTKAPGTDPVKYIVSKGDAFSAAKFAAALREKVTEKNPDDTTNPNYEAAIFNKGIAMAYADGKATASNLDLGYYFVTSTTGALCDLTTTNPEVTIHDKNDIPFDKVDDKDDNNVEVGENVHYTITGKVPDTTGFSDYIYKITDKMSAGLTFKADSVKVYVGGELQTAGANTYELKQGADAGANDFEVTIKVMNYTFGQEIKVEYDATVNEAAVATVSENDAHLFYSNDPRDYTHTEELTDKEVVFTAKIVVNKIEKDNSEKKLAGATFVLYKEVPGEGTAPATKMYYKYENEVVSWVTSRDEATPYTTQVEGVEDAKKGIVEFVGLKNGTYFLEETAAPAGYNLLDHPVQVVVAGSTKVEGNEVIGVDLVKGEDVENSTGSILPSTGGMGTTIFYVVGSIMLFGAVVLLVTKKRMSVAK